MQRMTWLKHFVEYMGGARDEPPTNFPLRLQSPLWGLWLALLALLIFAFSGQASRFIYIDF